MSFWAESDARRKAQRDHEYGRKDSCLYDRLSFNSQKEAYTQEMDSLKQEAQRREMEEAENRRRKEDELFHMDQELRSRAREEYERHCEEQRQHEEEEEEELRKTNEHEIY